MDLRQLRTFREIAEAGSLSRAADRLRIAQPALSRQIRLLEAEAGLPLYTRHGRGMTLTEAGAELLARVAGPEASPRFSARPITARLRAATEPLCWKSRRGAASPGR